MLFISNNKNQNIFKNPINIIQQIVRSLLACLPFLQHLLSDHKCSIALLSETQLLHTRSFAIPQFKVYRSDRSDGYGGVAIAVHNSLKSKLIPIVSRNRSTNHKIDKLGIEVHLTNSASPLKVWSCYISSDSNVLHLIWRDLFNLCSHKALLGGDFNAFHPAWGSDSISSRGSQIYDTINSLGLCILNNGSFTRVDRPNSVYSTIDLLFCSPVIIWYLSWQTLNEPHGSNYIPIIISANINDSSYLMSSDLNPNAFPINSQPFNFNKADWSSFSLQIQN